MGTVSATFASRAPGWSWAWSMGLAVALAVALLPPAPAAAQQAQDRAGLEHACPGERVPDSGFTDHSGNVHERAIDCAGWWQITRGGPEGRPANEYGPTLPVYRDQMASFIARMIDESEGTRLPDWDGRNRFQDVPDQNVHVANINRLARVGVVQGRTATTYAPREVVRRDQMASFIARAIHHVTETDRASDDDQFNDVDENNPHRRNINGLALEGVVRGIGGGRYAPAVQVRRDAMASFVMRGLDLHVDEGFATPPDARDDDDDGEEPPPETPEEPPTDSPEPSVSDFGPQTAAPELQQVETVTTTATQATVRYTFSHGVVADAVEAEHFLLYGIDTENERYEADDAERTAANVVTATFSRDQYDNATTAAVANGAVEDLSGLANPERALGLQARTFPAASTQAPDLVSVGNFRAGEGGALADFTFDRQVTAADTEDGLFGLVLADGTDVDGGVATSGSPNSDTVTVLFEGASHATLSANARRAYTDEDAVERDGITSPLRAVAVAEGGATGHPDLVDITMDRSQNRVTYEFDQEVARSGPNAPTSDDFTIFYVDGTQREGQVGTTLNPIRPTVSNDGLRVTVQFASGAVNPFVVGGSARSGAVRSLEGFNAVDTAGVDAEFVQGQVLGPRLMRATAESQPLPGGWEVTWQFDKDVELSDGDFVVYNADGERITTGAPTSAGGIFNCSDSADEVTCEVAVPPGTQLRLAAVEYDAVENDDNQTAAGGTVFPNYEQSRRFS